MFHQFDQIITFVSGFTKHYTVNFRCTGYLTNKKIVINE